MSNIDDQALDTRAAATYVGCSARKLENMRADGTGPTYYHVGDLVRYRKSALDSWIDQQSKKAQAATSVQEVSA